MKIEISGPPGCGKSITAWLIARLVQAFGIEVEMQDDDASEWRLDTPISFRDVEEAAVQHMPRVAAVTRKISISTRTTVR